MHSKNDRKYNNHRGAPYDATQDGNDATLPIAEPSTTADTVVTGTASNVAPGNGAASAGAPGTSTPSAARSTNTSTAPRRRLGRRRASALVLAAALATASLTACSLTSDGSNTPGGAASSQSRDRNTAPSAGKTSATPDKKNSPKSSSSKTSDSPSASASGDHVENAHLCGGLFSNEVLKDDLSFEPSEKKYVYSNTPPDEHVRGRMTCTIFDKNNGTNVSITYDGGDGTFVKKQAQDAESNEDGTWQAIAIDGQEGKGWVSSRAILHRAVWVYPDGSGFYISVMERSQSSSVVTKDHMSNLTGKLVGTIAKHNQTAGDANDSQY